MSITAEAEMQGMIKVSEAVATTLKMMRAHAQPGMTARELDRFGGRLLKEFGARSAPHLAYSFPGHTCISVNNEVAHGIPSADKIFKEGDLINIDVSAELDGFWSDNGGSFVLGKDVLGLQPLVEASKKILFKALMNIKSGERIAETGRIIESEARKMGFVVIKNLAGHGIGRSLHEEPHEILNYYNRFNRKRYSKNMVVAIETFISTRSTQAREQPDGWTLIGNKGGFVAQHEHTIVVTDEEPIILTKSNEIFN